MQQAHTGLYPNIDVLRDPRWGRVGETFGEDPYLVGEMGVAMIDGFQQSDFTGSQKVIACAKHLIGGGEPINGLNASPLDISKGQCMKFTFLLIKKRLMQVFFP